MKIDKIVKQLKREFAANKGRAAALGGCLLVAGYFWAPLVSGWLSSGKSKSVVVDSETEVVAILVAAVPVDTLEVTETAWQDIDRWITEDPHMRSAELTRDDLRPFAKLVVEDASSDEDAEEAMATAAVQPVVTPESLGLELTGVLMGSRRTVLQISGKTYVVSARTTAGDAPPQGLAFKSDHGSHTFQVDRVESRMVVLRQGEHVYTLRIKGSDLAGNAQMRLLSPRN